MVDYCCSEFWPLQQSIMDCGLCTVDLGWFITTRVSRRSGGQEAETEVPADLMPGEGPLANFSLCPTWRRGWGRLSGHESLGGRSILTTSSPPKAPPPSAITLGSGLTCELGEMPAPSPQQPPSVSKIPVLGEPSYDI